MKSSLWKIAVLLSLLPSLAARAEETPRYFAVFIDGKKVGHAVDVRKVAEGKVVSTMTLELTIRREQIALKLRQEQTCVETADGKPLSFTTVQDLGMGLMSQKTTGEIGPDGRLKITAATGGTTQTRTMDWPDGALLAEGLRLLVKAKGLKEGTTYTALAFEPGAQRAIESVVTVGPRRNVDLLGRVVPLTEVRTDMKTGTGTVNVLSYVNDAFEEQKSVLPMMGMKFELIACSRKAALKPNEEFDLLTKTLLPCPTPLENLGEARSVTYRLRKVSGKEFTLPSGDGQTVKVLEDGALSVTVVAPPPPAGVTLPYKGDDKTALEALKPAQFIQSDHEKVVALSRQAVGDAKDAAEAVRRIESFVHKYIRKKNLSVGYASAAEVAVSREGDCSEHAVLTAALCRAVGIPAQVVCGMVYVPQFAGQTNVFGPHAWNRVRIGDTWVGLDSAIGGYHPGHIAVSYDNGNPDSFLDAVPILGEFRIEEARVEK